MNFLLGLLSFCCGSALATITNCDTSSVFTITKLAQDPLTDVIAGQNITLSLLYVVPEEITEGTVENKYTYNSIPLTPTTDSLCTVVDCPLTSGEHDGSTSYPFPGDVKGTLVGQITWRDLQGRTLLCIKSTLKNK